MFGYIYETTNIINGKTYIGKCKGKFNEKYYGSGKLLRQALRKYGVENFIIVLLCECNTEEELNAAEIMYIKTLDPTYNIAKGGTGGDTLARADISYKQKIIAKRKQSLSTVWGSISEQQRKQWCENISKAKKGKRTGPSNYKHSEEVKRQISESNKNVVRPESWYLNHSKAMSLRRGQPMPKRRTPVEINGVIYLGVAIAAEELKVTRHCINRWLKNGKAKYVK